MPEKIEETLKKLAADTSKDGSTTESRSERVRSQLGDPDCPHCHGIGYLRQELPIDHPKFGKLETCTCRDDAIRDRIRSRLFQFSNLDKLEHLTFETFNPKGRIGIGDLQKDSLHSASNLARDFAKSPKGWLFVQGRFGCGKTHLAAAIANECVGNGIPTLFLTVPDLLDSLRFTFNDREVSFEERFNQIRQSPLLILDDFGTQNATEWAKEKLFQILNYRYVNNLPMVVTTNLALAGIDGRLRSRLEEHGFVRHIKITAPDYRRKDDERGQHELSSLELHPKQTFGTFNFRQKENLLPDHITSLENAFKLAQAYSEDPSGWLVISGLHGCGKTHLAAAVANYRASQGHQVMFIMTPDLLDHLRSTFSPNSSTSYDRLFDEIRSTNLLVLDDLRSKGASLWAREKLIQLIDFRYNSNLSTVITTAEKFEDIDPSLQSRIRDERISTIVTISAPAYRGKRNRKGKR
ncbi:MAG: ATP-binding protein [Anaerolineales bacterium]|jgi:DNA replication protein DnaC